MCRGPAPQLVPGQAVKVMTWNVQHLAGKQYVFWNDLPDGSGPDDRATAEDLAYNLDEVDPDGARFRRTNYDDVAFVGQVSEYLA